MNQSETPYGVSARWFNAGTDEDTSMETKTFVYSQVVKDLAALLKTQINNGDISPLQALHQLRNCGELVSLYDAKKMLGVN
jgi:hypothetical protein